MAEPIEKRIAKIVESEALKGRIVSAVSVKGAEVRVEYAVPEAKDVNSFDLINYQR